MKAKTRHNLNPLFICLVFFSSQTLAFSPSPDIEDNYSPADWANSDSAEYDAETAIKHNDYRLLGFAGRGFNLPGIDVAQSQDYSDKCGVRYFKDFGDVIRDREQIEQRKKAKQYAIDYNKVILTSCTLSE